MTNSNQPTSTNSPRRIIALITLSTLFFCTVTPQLLAQSTQSQDVAWNSRSLVEQLARTPKNDSLTDVVDSSAETLKKRLEESPNQPAGNASINTVASRNTTTAAAPQGHMGEAKFSMTAYAFLAGLKGDVGAEGHVVYVDAPFTEAIDHLNFAFATVFEVHLSKNWMLLADINYLNLSDGGATPGPLFETAELDIKSFFSSIEVGYNVARRPSVRFDVTGGMRVFVQSMNLELRRGSTQVNVEKKNSWVDPIVGFRLHAGDKVFVALKGDIGGFGAASTFTWHVFGGLGLNLTKHMTLVGGYRYLDVDYRSKDFIYDTAMSGLLLGLGLRF